jgi:pyruvate dehydrogenase E1 component alpha subunit
MISDKDIEKIYLDILKIRIIEETISKKYKDQEMRCPIHLSIGQEAIAVGVCQNLNDKDQIVSNHRCHAHYLAKGGDVDKMINEFYGNSYGCSGGRGGSMHLFDQKKGILSSVPIVSSAIPVGVGAGFSFKYNKEKNIAVIFLGDAAIEEGVFYESLNYAKILSLPVLFICENNLFSCFTNIKERQPDNLIKNISKSFGIRTHFLNGNNAVDIFNKTKKIIKQIRALQEPQFILLDTYRMYEHCGPHSDDYLNYRNPKITKYWSENDPLDKIEKIIKTKSIFSKNQIDKIKLKYKKDINKIFETSKKNKFSGTKLEKIKLYA